MLKVKNKGILYLWVGFGVISAYSIYVIFLLFIMWTRTDWVIQNIIQKNELCRPIWFFEYKSCTKYTPVITFSTKDDASRKTIFEWDSWYDVSNGKNIGDTVQLIYTENNKVQVYEIYWLSTFILPLFFLLISVFLIWASFLKISPANYLKT